MEVISKDMQIKVQNASSATIFEYPQNTTKINGVIAVISGRYPLKGFVVNTKVTELAYILEGKGKVIKKDGESFSFKQGNIVIIENNEVYAWQGNFKMLLVSTPAWSPEQHKEVK